MARLGLEPAPRLHIAQDVGSGPPVVLVHGIASTAATWHAVLPLLRERHRCITIELLGFGASPAGREYTAEEHVRALRATIRRLRLPKPYTLIGHSLGALLGARYARAHRRELDRLLLVAPPVYLAEDEITRPMLRMTTGLYRQAYELLQQHPEFTVGAGGAVARLFPPGVFELGEHNWAAFTGSLRNCIVQQSLLADLTEVRTQGLPVDVLYGALDEFLPPGGMAPIAAIPGVSVHRMAGSRHEIRPRMAAAIAELLGARPAPTA